MVVYILFKSNLSLLRSSNFKKLLTPFSPHSHEVRRQQRLTCLWGNPKGMPKSSSYILIFQWSLIVSHFWKERLWRTAVNRLTSKQLSSWSPRQQHHAVHTNSVNKTVGIFLRCRKTEIQMLTYMSQEKQTYQVCEILREFFKTALLFEKHHQCMVSSKVVSVMFGS